MLRKKREEYLLPDYAPAILRSICTGEAVFGFIRKADDKFIPISAVDSRKSAERLCRKYGAEPSAICEIY